MEHKKRKMEVMITRQVKEKNKFNMTNISASSTWEFIDNISVAYSSEN